jgi:quercetin dioxygenase-like cupin family protein
MTPYNWANVEREQLNPLLARQVIHGDRITLARIHLAKGCIVPEHSHEQEQLSWVKKGRLRFELAGAELILGPGDVLPIPSGAPHRVEALEESFVIDIFSPCREDWRSGNDQYLRK